MLESSLKRSRSRSQPAVFGGDQWIVTCSTDLNRPQPASTNLTEPHHATRQRCLQSAFPESRSELPVLLNCLAPQPCPSCHRQRHGKATRFLPCCSTSAHVVEEVSWPSPANTLEFGGRSSKQHWQEAVNAKNTYKVLPNVTKSSWKQRQLQALLWTPVLHVTQRNHFWIYQQVFEGLCCETGVDTTRKRKNGLTKPRTMRNLVCTF